MTEPQIPDVYNHYLPLGWTVADEPHIPSPDVVEWTTASHLAFTSTASTNSTSVKNSLTSLQSLLVFNTNGNYARYLRLYDVSGVPSTADVPIRTITIPAGGSMLVYSAGGEQYTNGLGFDITGASGDSDATAINAGDVVLYIGYQ